MLKLTKKSVRAGRPDRSSAVIGKVRRAPKTPRPHRGVGAAPTIVLVAMALLSGCAQTKDWLDSIRGGDSADESAIHVPSADEYLETLRQLTTGDPAMQAEIYAEAESLSTLTPHPSTNLRFALVLATPGHAGSDPQRAQSMLRALRDQTELLTPAEIALTDIQLNEVDERVRLTVVSRESEQATKRRIAAAEAENGRLRSELADAEGKLEAITSIERSIREREQ